MEKVRPWCGQPSDRVRQNNRTFAVTVRIAVEEEARQTAAAACSGCSAMYERIRSVHCSRTSLEFTLS